MTVKEFLKRTNYKEIYILYFDEDELLNSVEFEDKKEIPYYLQRELIKDYEENDEEGWIEIWV